MISLYRVKRVPIEAPILSLSYSTRHMKLDDDICDMKLDDDICDVKLGCIQLQQKQSETTKAGEYWYRSLLDAEDMYDTK